MPRFLTRLLQGMRLLLSLVTHYDRVGWEYIRFVLFGPGGLDHRVEIARRFRQIHRAVPCAHQEAELLFLAEEILRLPPGFPGDLLECGCWKGGSSCKLSIVAQLTDRRLIVCDSFSGLPDPAEHDRRHFCYNGREKIYRQGDYAGSLQEVRENLERFGESAVVELVPGYFEETLAAQMPRPLALIFIDVDLYESMTCCIENLWPSLQPGGRFFTHEARDPVTVRAFTEERFWQERLGISPPTLVGGATGLDALRQQLAYVEKPPDEGAVGGGALPRRSRPSLQNQEIR